jgi:hypothetical protein
MFETLGIRRSQLYNVDRCWTPGALMTSGVRILRVRELKALRKEDVSVWI